jgi:hypothetical protein
MRAAAFTCAAVVLLAGCKTLPPGAPTSSDAPADAPPADGAAAGLAPPDAVGTRSASQVIHAAYGSRAVVLRTVIEAAPGKLDVVGVTATGQRVFSAHYDGRTLDARKSPFVPDKLDPARVLADMQLALWPLPAVQAAFRERGLTVTEPFAGVRRLSRGDALLAEVHYASTDPWSGRLWLVSFEFDYSLTIDTTTN